MTNVHLNNVSADFLPGHHTITARRRQQHHHHHPYSKPTTTTTTTTLSSSSYGVVTRQPGGARYPDKWQNIKKTELFKWLVTKNYYFKRNTGVSKTELSHTFMDGTGCAAVPPKDNDEFNKLYARVIETKPRRSSKNAAVPLPPRQKFNLFVVELKTPVFAPFFDVDLKHDTIKDVVFMESLVRTIQYCMHLCYKRAYKGVHGVAATNAHQYGQKFKAILLTTPPRRKQGQMKSAAHIVFPNLSWDLAMARKFWAIFVYCLSEQPDPVLKAMPFTKCLDPTLQWDNIIDSAVYNHAGLRLPYSKKIDKCSKCDVTPQWNCSVCNPNKSKNDTPLNPAKRIIHHNAVYTLHKVMLGRMSEEWLDTELKKGGINSVAQLNESLRKREESERKNLLEEEQRHKLINICSLRRFIQLPDLFLVEPKWFRCATNNPSLKEILLTEFQNGAKRRTRHTGGGGGGGGGKTIAPSTSTVFVEMTDPRYTLIERLVKREYKELSPINATKLTCYEGREYMEYFLSTRTHKCLNLQDEGRPNMSHSSNVIYFYINRKGIQQRCHSEGSNRSCRLYRSEYRHPFSNPSLNEYKTLFRDPDATSTDAIDHSVVGATIQGLELSDDDDNDTNTHDILELNNNNSSPIALEMPKTFATMSPQQYRDLNVYMKTQLNRNTTTNTTPPSTFMLFGDIRGDPRSNLNAKLKKLKDYNGFLKLVRDDYHTVKDRYQKYKNDTESDKRRY